MLLNEIKPSVFLSEYIRLYRIVDFSFSDDVAIPPKMYTPRPEQCLQFYPKDTEGVRYPGSDKMVTNIQAVITGQHTTMHNRYIGKNFLSFQVVFQPGGLFRICGVDMHELTNQYLDAELIFGKQLRDVNERLYTAASYEAMVSIVESFLFKMIRPNSVKGHTVDVSGKRMLQQPELLGVDNFLKESFLCHRQYDRKFNQRVGVSPKQFLQIIRFDRAYRLKNRFPDKDWLTIALHCGYHDYQHLSKDYMRFTGYTPTQFFELDHAAPERVFGFTET